MRRGEVCVEPLKSAVERSGISKYELAKRCGRMKWNAQKNKRVPDSSWVTKKWRQQTVDYRTAERIMEAAGLCPTDVEGM